MIEQKIARGLKVALELPLEIAKPFLAGLNVEYKINRKKKIALIHLPYCQRLTIPRVPLPPKARLRCRFVVRGLPKHGRPGNMIAIGQHYEGQEVGRVSWRFTNKRDPQKIC